MIKLINRLGQPQVLPITFGWLDASTNWTLPKADLGGDGAVLTGRQHVKSRMISIVGVMAGDDADALRNQIDSLKAFLVEGPIRVYRRETDTRYTEAIVTGVSVTPQEGDTWLDVRINLEALDPYWYGPDGSHQRQISEELSVWTISNVGGNCPTPPVVRFTFGSGSSVQDPVLEHKTSGKRIQLVGTFLNGDVIEIDCRRFQALRNGVLALDLLSTVTLVDGFELVPGNNSLEFRATGSTVAVTVEISWRPRWY